MYLEESLIAMRMALISQCMFLEEVRKNQIEKVAGDYLPMQDHLAECTWGKHPDLNWDVKECLDYIGKLNDGLTHAFVHGQLAKSKGLGQDFEIAKIADMLWGGVHNNYPDDLINCAKEVSELVKKTTPKRTKNNKKGLLEWQRKVMKEIKKICDKYDIEFPIYSEWTIQEGYIMDWLKSVYEIIG